VTDANVLLGRIAADRPLGGGLLQAMRSDLSEKAIQTHVAEPLGLSTMEAAEAILTVANAKMAGAVRVVSIEKGHDPRQFAYMPFGGGGGLHVCAMMREVVWPPASYRVTPESHRLWVV
jgi:N-methylhydantoinase A